MSPVARAYLFMGLEDHATAQKVLEPIAHRLRTRNSSDTVDRLFRSTHVNDLRLIAAVVVIVAVWIVFLGLLSAIVGAIVDWGAAQSPPLGGVQRVFHAFHVARSDFLLLFGPAVALVGGVLTWAYQVGSARLGVVDLFACEIDTLCRVTVVTDTVRRQTERYYRGPPGPATQGDRSAAPRESFSSEENYFPILESNARDLQNLEADVVVNITAFYTYMKVVRDSLRGLAAIAPATGETEGSDATQHVPGSAPLIQPWHDAMRNVMYMLYLALESGRHAIRDLVEFQPDQTERTIVILISELSVYRFLREQYTNPTEMHYDRLILRGPEYKALVPELTDCVNLKRKEALSAVPRGTRRDDLGDDTRASRLWLAAFQLLGELGRRYKELTSNFSLDCVATDDRVVAESSSPKSGYAAS
jgi:hypothetical protein